MHFVITSMRSVIDFFDRDVLLTAATVIPATMVWIQTESMWFAAFAGVAMYVAVAHGYFYRFADDLLQGLLLPAGDVDEGGAFFGPYGLVGFG